MQNNALDKCHRVNRIEDRDRRIRKGTIMKVGSGDLKFEAIEGWGELPPGWNFGRIVTAVAVDSQDRLYVFNRGEHPIIIFDKEGRFLDSWGEGVFTRPHGLCIAPDETIFCVDDDGHAIRQFRLDGAPLKTISVDKPADTGYEPGYAHSVARSGPPFCYPTDLVVSPGGDMYISDGYGNARIHKYTGDGKLLFSWGDPGNGPSQFVIPHGMCVDREGRLYVADRQNERIQIFNSNGEFITQWTSVLCPNKMVIDDEDIMYVAELGLVVRGDKKNPIFLANGPHARITLRNLDGNILTEWGAQDPSGTGLFFAPHGIALDSEKSIYVGEVAGSYSRGRVAPDKPVLNKYVRV